MRHRPARWKWIGSAVTLVLFAAAACGDGALDPEFDGRSEMYVVRTMDDGFLHTVRLSQAEPRAGDTLRIESIVVNVGGARTVESRICGLDLRTDLELVDPVARCRGYSMEGRLESGDAVRSGDVGVVRSRPGTYDIRLRHLLDPEQWLTIEVRVTRP